jgi:alpha-galactosidase
MDAGWYPCKDDWTQVGTWEPDSLRFPRGLRAVADHAHASGLKLVVWFEPERVTPGTWLYDQHPEWLLGKESGTKLLNLGNPQARHWLTDQVDKLLTEQGIDLYRQDFNIDPLGYWRANDPPDRQGLTELHHVEGYLAYWDELRRRHPDLLIDSCASGGRRNDLETLRRAVPLLRSDYQSFQGDPAYAVGNQGHTYGLALWLPYFGQGVYYNPRQLVYNARSHFCPGFGFCCDVRKPGADWGQIRAVAEEWRQVAPLFFGDYYPLTPYRLDADTWMAWQFDRPDRGDGMIQVFRRGGSAYESARFPLRGLAPEANYLVQAIDEPGKSTACSGRELTEQGLRIVISNAPSATILLYRRAP